MIAFRIETNTLYFKAYYNTETKKVAFNCFTSLLEYRPQLANVITCMVENNITFIDHISFDWQTNISISLDK